MDTVTEKYVIKDRVNELCRDSEGEWSIFERNQFCSIDAPILMMRFDIEESIFEINFQKSNVWIFIVNFSMLY